MKEAPGFEAGMASLREYTDVVKGFLEENYELVGEITLDSSGKFQKENNNYVEWRDLMENYQLYCASNNFQKLNGKKFQQELARFNCIRKHKRIGKEHTGGGRKPELVVYGLRVFEDTKSLQRFSA